MSERTPQDVLREDEVMARLSSDNPKSRWHREERSDGWSSWRCIPIRDAVEVRFAAIQLLDKAIAEAPDPNPQLCDCRGRGSLYPNEHAFGCPMFEAPDALSEKPGLDVERLAKAASRFRISRAEPRASYTAANQSCVEAIAAEYARLASTDSEGR